MDCCPLCRSNSKVLHIGKSCNYDILYCSGCQLRFSYSRGENERDFYTRSPLYADRSLGTLVDFSLEDWRFKTFFALVKPQPKDSLLDVGCGDGAFIDFVRKNGTEVFGIDIDARAVSLAKNLRKLQNVKNASWDGLKGIAREKTFDIITLFDVLEHIPDPCLAGSVAFDLLKPGGTICISVPRIDRYPRIFDAEADYPPHHFTLWTRRSLELLMRRSGFREAIIIEKPLTAEDLLFNVYLRITRFLRKAHRDNNIKIDDNKKQQPLFYLKHGFLFRLAKAMAILFLKPFNYFLRILRLGRGHTLLAMARKPL